MDIFISILLIVIGGVFGYFITGFVNRLNENNALSKADAIIEKAKKDAEKAKRDTILETKEEIHKLKLELEQDKN